MGFPGIGVVGEGLRESPFSPDVGASGRENAPTPSQRRGIVKKYEETLKSIAGALHSDAMRADYSFIAVDFQGPTDQYHEPGGDATAVNGRRCQ